MFHFQIDTPCLDSYRRCLTSEVNQKPNSRKFRFQTGESHEREATRSEKVKEGKKPSKKKAKVKKQLPEMVVLPPINRNYDFKDESKATNATYDDDAASEFFPHEGSEDHFKSSRNEKVSRVVRKVQRVEKIRPNARLRSHEPTYEERLVPDIEETRDVRYPRLILF